MNKIMSMVIVLGCVGHCGAFAMQQDAMAWYFLYTIEARQREIQREDQREARRNQERAPSCWSGLIALFDCTSVESDDEKAPLLITPGNDNRDSECVICFDPVDARSRPSQLACHHTQVHSRCLQQWHTRQRAQQLSPDCPVCRTK